MSRKDDIKSLIAIYNRNLQKFKEQRASFGGLHVPPYILTEIENIESEIKNLQIELTTIGDSDVSEILQENHLELFSEHIKYYPTLEDFFKRANGNLNLIPQQYRDMIIGIQRIANGFYRRSNVVVLGSRIIEHRKRTELCTIIGSFLGRSGHVLLHGSSDIGQEVAKAFHAVNPQLGYILNYHSGSKETLPFGSMVSFNSLDEMRQALTNNGDFFIVIGGGSGTAKEIKLAKEKGKEVFVFRDEMIK